MRTWKALFVRLLTFILMFYIIYYLVTEEIKVESGHYKKISNEPKVQETYKLWSEK